MSRSGRAGLLAALLLAGSLLAPSPASAAPGDPVPLFVPGPSSRFDVLQPLGQTTAGLVWRVQDQPGLLVKLTGGATTREDRLSDPVLKGDLITSVDGEAGSITWRTIADAELRVHEIPDGLEYVSRTSKGYLAQRAAGRHEIVSVDLLTGSAPRVLGWKTNYPFLRLTAGPDGVLGATAKPGGELRYYPYGTAGEGRRISGTETTGGADVNVCPVVTKTHAFCAGTGGRMVRTSLSVLAPPVSAGGDVTRLVATATGVAYLVEVEAGSYALRTWSSSSGTTAPVAGATGFSGTIAAGGGGTSTIVSRDQAGADSGLWSVALPSGKQTKVRAAAQQDRTATDVAIGPARVAWIDNAVDPYTMWWQTLAATGTPTGTAQRLFEQAPGGTIALGTAFQIAWTTERGLRVPSYGVDHYFPDVVSVTASGNRLLQATSTDDGLQWGIREVGFQGYSPADAPLRVDALPPALDYDLWGDRLVRLTADGEVSLLELSTDADPVVLRASTPGDDIAGEVHLAGDAVVWEVAVDGTAEVMVEDLAGSGPATALGEFDDVLDLSTGYAVGRRCTGDDCTTEAVALAGGQVTSLGDTRDVAVDGNRVALIGPDGVPAVRTLPTYPDPPRLLHPVVDPQMLAAPGRNWRAPVLTSRPLSSCVFEVLDPDDVVVRTLSCASTGGQAALAWGGLDDDGDVLPDGEYGWHIVAEANGEALVDSAGGPGVSGTLTVDDLEPRAYAGRPASQDLAVDLAVRPTVDFSEPVTGADATNVTLSRTAGGSLVPATVVLAPGGRSAELRPDAPLDSDTSWTVSVGAAGAPIVDSLGQPVTPTTYRFTTGPVPTITARYPVASATGVSRTASIVVAFSEPVTGAGRNAAFLRDSSGPYVSTTVSYNTTSRRLTIDPAVTLRPGHRYSVQLVGGWSGIRDLADNHLATTTWQFTTAS